MLQEIKDGFVRSETKNGVTIIEFYHPQQNSLPSKILSELANTISGVGNEPETKVIVLKSVGDKTFCAGASFDELSQIGNEKDAIEFFSGFANVINAMRRCPKFIIARVQGKCVGGGVGIAAAADYAIAVEGADIKLSELAVGIGPFVVGPAVERKIGKSSFSQLAIDAFHWRNADWARRKGLYAELHPSVENMDASIEGMVNHLSSSSVEAMKELKKILWEGTDHWSTLLYDRAKISGRLILTPHSKKAIQAFKEKQSVK